MAVDLQRTIEIIFAGVDNVGPTVQSVGRSLDELQGKVGGVTGPMADWTKTILAAETALVGVGLAMAGVAVNQAGEFQTNIKEIGTLFNGTADQVQGLGDQILDYATVSTASIDEINQAAYKAISTGTDYADAVKLVADAEVLATAGRANLADTTAVLTSSLNAYGDGVQQAADYSDSLFAAVQTGNTNLPELASNLGKITGVASAAGVPFDDLVATLSALTITTGNTAESSTKLRALLTELIKPSDELQAALGGTTLAGDGLQAVMEVLQSKTGGSAEEMVKLFGSTEATQAALALANDSSGAFASALQAQAERAGIAAAANDEMGKSFESLNQNLLNVMQVSFIGAGQPLLDEYESVVTELAGLFKTVSFEFRGGAFDALYDGAEGAAEQISGLLAGIAEALPEALEQIDYDGLLSAFGEVGQSINGLFGDLDLTGSDDLAKVIQAVVDGVTALTRVTAGAVEGLGPFIRTLADLVDQINKGDEALQELVGQVLGFATGVDALLPSLGGLGNVLATVGGAMAVMGGAKQAGAAITGMKGMALALTGPGMLLAAFGAAAYVITDFGLEVSKLADKMEEYRKEDQRWMDSASMTDNWGDMILKAKELGAEVDHLADAFEETYGITIEQAQGYASVTEAMDAAAQAARDSAEADREAADAKSKQVLAASEQTLAEFARKDALEQQRAEQEAYKQSIIGVIDKYGDLTRAEWELLDVTERNEYTEAKRIANKEGWLDAAEKAAKAVDDETKALEREKQLRKDAADELFRQTQLTYDYQIALEEIASDERFRIIELEFNLELEELRQQGETARSIIESINTTITSTGETLSDLAGNLAGFSSTTSSGYREMFELVQAEERRRDEALKMQKELTEAQVDQMDAQTALLRQRADAYARGDAAITINGEGLQPHLEAFMWEILETIQTRVNAEGHAMLLGV